MCSPGHSEQAISPLELGPGGLPSPGPASGRAFGAAFYPDLGPLALGGLRSEISGNRDLTALASRDQRIWLFTSFPLVARA